APILPHVTEEIYQQLHGDMSDSERGAAGLASIHASAWPLADPSLIDEQAEQAGTALLAITSATRRFKSAHRLGLGAELAHLAIAASDPWLRAALEQSKPDIRSVTRAREITFVEKPDERFEELEPELWTMIEG